MTSEKRCAALNGSSPVTPSNAAAGLRAIADALDGGQLDGKHLSTMAAAGGTHDDRIHLRVSLDLAAPIVQRDDFVCLPALS